MRQPYHTGICLLRRAILLIIIGLMAIGPLFSQDEVLIATQSEWKYLDDGTNPGSLWNKIAFNDEAWKSGKGKFGYGEGNENTILGFGPDAANKFITYFFRFTIYIPDPFKYKSLTVKLLRDDGAIVYINGSEVIRSNMPPSSDFSTLALEGIGDADEYTYFPFNIKSNSLVTGNNVIAVEVHQNAVGSSDLGFDLELTASTKALVPLKINEVMASNVSANPDPEYKQFGDWIELYNGGTEPYPLTGNFLSDDPDEYDKWKFPTGTTVPPGGYLLVYANGLNTGLNTNFQLTKSGERIAIFNNDGTLIDTLTYPPLNPNVSYGSMEDGMAARGYFWSSTPGSTNKGGVARNQPLPLPVFSELAGFYSGSVSLQLSCTDEEAVIRYSRDGSDPVPNSSRYTAPLSITANTVVKARAFRDGVMPSSIVTNTYFIGEDIDLAVISIGIEPEFLDDPELGIYLDDKLDERREWERPATFELFEPDGTRGFLTNVDLRLFGRSAVRFPQKSFGVFARPTNGADGLNYPLFPGTPYTHYQSFVLRSSSDDWRNTMFRDGMCQSLIQDHLDLIQQDYRPSIVFINGEFMGIHNIRDKINNMHLATHKGVDPENLDIIYVDNDYNPPVIEAKSGDDGAFWAMWNFISKNDMSNPSNYATASTMIDLDNLIDFYCVQILVANQSWRHNCKFWREKKGDTRFRCVVWDMDYGYQFIERNNLNEITANEPLIKSLVKNVDFKSKLKTRLDFLSQSLFTTERSLHFIDSMAAEIEPYIQRHANRWKGTMTGTFSTTAEWNQRVEVMRNFARSRPARHDAYIKSYFGVSSKKAIKIKVDPPGAGTIFVNDNYLTDTDYSGSLYTNSVVKLTAVPNPGYTFNSWLGIQTSVSTIFPMGSTWSYLDNGSNQGTAWRSLSFNDASWKSGTGAFGYGETTGISTTVSYGSDSQDKYITTYFRKKFTVQDPQNYTSLSIEMLRDDGVVIYLNGTEISRSNMPSGTVSHTTLASSDIHAAIENTVVNFTVGADLLVIGTNVIAVELHQFAANSVDLRFDMKLSASQSTTDSNPSKSLTLDKEFDLIASFQTPMEGPLVITEINYGPPATLGDDSEYIELLNTSQNRIALQGYSFDGIEYTFSANSFIQPGQYILVARNSSLYSYLQVPVFEWTAGDLSNSGEEIVFRNSSGTIIDKVHYKNSSPWPAGITGSGYSIELTDFGTDNSQGANWKASSYQNGSPGSINPGSIYKNLKINELVGIPTKSGYLGNLNWFEILNTGTKSVNLSGYYLSNDPDNPVKYRIPEGFDSLTTIKPKEYRIFIAENTSEVGPLHVPFKLKGDSGSLVLTALAGDRMVIVDRVDYALSGKGTSLGRLPDGTGNFITLNAPSPGRANHQTDNSIIVASRIRPGDEVPVVVRIRNSAGETDRTLNGNFRIEVTHGTVEPDTIRIRHGMGSEMVTFTATQDFEVSLRGYPFKRYVEVSEKIPVVTLTGPISKPTTLAAGVDYLIKSNLEITSAGNLIVPEGTRLFVDSIRGFNSKGRMKFKGTLDQPIVIIPAKPTFFWGGIEIQNVDSLSEFEWVMIGKGGGYPGKGRGHGLKQPVILGIQTQLNLNHFYLTDCPGRAGYTEYADVNIRNSFTARCAVGYEFRFSHARVYNSWFMEIPDNDWTVRLVDTDALYFWEYKNFNDPHVVENCVITRTEDDGIDMLTAPVIVRNTLFSGIYEKGISAGYRSRVEVDRSVFNGMYGGAQSSYGGELIITNSTFYNITRPVFSYDSYGIVTNSILAKHKTLYSSDTLPSFYFDHCISDSDPDLLGKGNIFGNPGLKDPGKLDFNLVSGSKSINQGNPETGLDPDGSLPDLGAYIFEMSTRESLIFNEIHYHPAEAQGAESTFEFIELINISGRSLDLSAVRLTGQVEFTFPAGTSIDPGEIVVLASDRFAYSDLSCQVFSWKPGLLSNNTGTLKLVSNTGALLDEITYTDSSPWPMAADGQGYSLSLTSPGLDNSVVANWAASYVFGGTPGFTNIAPDFTQLKINELFVSSGQSGSEGDVIHESWVELYNSGLLPVNVGGLYWSDDSSNPLKWKIPVNQPDITVVPSRGCLLFRFASQTGNNPLNIGLTPSLLTKNLYLVRQILSQNQTIDQVSVQVTSYPASRGRYPNGSGGLRDFIYSSPGVANTMPAKHIISPRTMVMGERLPIAVVLDTLEGLEPQLITGPVDLTITNGTLRSRAMTMVKGVGSLTSKIETGGSHIKLSLPEYNDTLTVEISPKRHLIFVNNDLPFGGIWTSEHDYWIPSWVEIQVGRKLVIMPGTRILLGKNARIEVNGTLEVLGTADNPVLFTSHTWGEPWGGIILGQYASQSTFSHTFFINGGADASRATGHSASQAVISTLGGMVNIDHCYFIDNLGKALYSSGATLTILNSIISRCDAGIEVYNGRLQLDRSFIFYLPDESQTLSDTKEHDAIYLNGKLANYTESANISNSVIGLVTDDAIDALNGSGASVNHVHFFKTGDKALSLAQNSISGSYLTFESCDEGVSAREAAYAYLDHSTFHKNTTALRSYSTSLETGLGHVIVSNSIFSASVSADLVKDGENEASISYSLSDKTTFAGNGNKLGDAKFTNSSSGDFRLSAGSPAIDAGDPSFVKDPDGSRSDMGAYWYNQQSSGNLIITEIFYNAGSGTTGDFIELLNISESPIDLNGYRLEGVIDFTITQSINVSPGEYFVIAQRASDFSGSGFIVIQWTSGDLPVAGNISLMRPSGFLEDKVDYQAGDGWPSWPLMYLTSIELEDIKLNNSLASSWRTSYYKGGTPGRTNQVAPVEGIYLNEILPRNTRSYPDETGQFSDWLELYNGSTHFVNLGGLFLTKTKTIPGLFQITGEELDSTLIPPDGYYVFWLDEQPAKGFRHSNFLLPGAGSFVGISKQQGGSFQWIDTLTYPSSSADISYGRSPDASLSLVHFDAPTPGAPNRLPQSRINGLYINELMARNTLTIRNNLNEYDDWLELYNSGNEPVDVGGLYLSDHKDNRLLWKIPATRPDSTTILPRGFLLLYPTAKPEAGVRHVDFQLTGGGEFVSLSQVVNGEMFLLDSLTYPVITNDISFGRTQDGKLPWIRFFTSTPGFSNHGASGLDVTGNPSDGIAVFPNPATSRITIQVETGGQEILSIKIVDIMGKVTKKWDGNELPMHRTINLEWTFGATGDPDSGIYMVLVHRKDKLVLGKFTICR